MATSVFDGRIAGVGTSSGVRLVVGAWVTSPLGAFADVMLETAAGHRLLLAPTGEVADFVAGTYAFDEVRVEAVSVTTGDTWAVRTDSLVLDIVVGRRHLVSAPLRLVPGAVRDREPWARLTDPVARLLMPGVRTHGSAGSDRTQWYAARAVHRVASVSGMFEGSPLGGLAPLRPAVRFGFSSAPAAPSVTRVRSFVRDLD